MGASIDALDPDLAQGCRELLQVCAQAGLQARVTSTVRTAREQSFLYKRYLSGASALPAAPPGHSAHEYGWAFDMIVVPHEFQPNVGKAWENYWGGKWGGSVDPVHFELPGAGALAYKLGEEGAQPVGAPADRQESLAAKVYDVGLGMFVPVYGTAQLVASIAQLAPGLSKSVILDWVANPGKYPELTYLQELVTLL